MHGTLGGRSVSFLIDSGATVSVVNCDVLLPSAQAAIANSAPLTVGANGILLDVLGTVMLALSIGTVSVEHTFVVARQLTVDCLLGMDFLAQYGAVIDCSNNKLTLLPEQREVHNRGAKCSRTVLSVVCVAQTTKIPGRSQILVKGKLDIDSVIEGVEGLFEPTDRPSQKGLLFARSLSKVGSNNEMLVHVINVGHEETTIYKGTRMGAFTSGQCVMSVGDEGDLKAQNDRMPEVDLSSPGITPQEKKLEKLLYDFRGLFVSESGPLGRTSVVKHAIKTMGPPIREPLRQIPHSLQNEVATEVKRMMEGGVIRQSNSPWSSPVVMVRKRDGSWRFCVNYRKVNEITQKDAYPLPRIDKTLEALSGAQLFTTLDLA